MISSFGRSSFAALVVASRLLLSASGPFADDVVIDEPAAIESTEESFDPEEEPVITESTEETSDQEGEPVTNESTEEISDQVEEPVIVESMDVVLEKLAQLLDKLDQVLDKMDQLLDKLDQNVTSSNEVMFAVIAGSGIIAGLMVFFLIFR